MNEMQALILAGGRGKRMGVLCDVKPKPALHYAGAFRVIDYTLSNCLNSGIEKIAALTDYRHEQMADYLTQWQHTHANHVSLDILPPKYHSYKGTADAVHQNADFLRRSDASLVIVLAGDHIYDMDYRKMAEFHRQSGADATVGVIGVPSEDAYRFGTVKMDASSRITAFREKSSDYCGRTASMGIYIFNKDILLKRLAEDAEREDSLHDFGYAVIPDMVKRDKVFAYLFNGKWQDIGTIGCYYAANMELLGGAKAGQWDGADASLMNLVNSERIKNSLVSPGCVVKGVVENSILSPGVYVEEGAIIRDSILLPYVSVGGHSVVDKCILDEDANVGRFCYVGFDDGLKAVETGITVVGSGSIIPGHSVICRGGIVHPYTGSPDFRKKAEISTESDNALQTVPTDPDDCT